MNLRRAAAAAALSAAVIAPLCSAPALAWWPAPSGAAAPTFADAATRGAHGKAATATTVAPDAAADAGRTAAAVPDGTYNPLPSVRLLDTRNGNGAPVMLWPQGAISVQIGGRGGVPSSGVSAVVLNVTAVGPSAGTWITAWPNGGTEPRTSNLNINAGENRANLVTVAVGGDGKVNFRNANGYTHLLADVVGYYSNASGVAGGGYHPEPSPYRAYDSRQFEEAWAPGEDAFVYTLSDTMDPSVRAVAVNITALPSTGGYLTVYGGGARPNASTVNFVGGRATPNLAVVPVAFDEDGYPMIKIFNSAGTTDVLIDVVGWYDGSATAESFLFTPVAPTRALDTRLSGGPLTASSTRLAPTASVAPGAVAVVANVTGVSPTGNTWVGVNSTATKPAASTLNLVPGETRPNLTHAPAGASGFYVYNAVGSTNVIADVFGYFS
ncbi:hypothetical protein GCM10028777_06560 [Angustibacter speluncae]